LLSCKKDKEFFSKDGQRLPVKLYVYATDKSNLIQTYYFKYNGLGQKIETWIFDKDNIKYSFEKAEYNSNGNIIKEHFFYKQPDGSFKEAQVKSYIYSDSNNQHLLIKQEKFSYGELTNWISYQYQNQNLVSEIFYVRYPEFNQISISGKNEYEYDSEGKLIIRKKFYGENTTPSYIHQLVYDNSLLVRENITTNLFPETIECFYNFRKQLLAKKHFENSQTLLDSETNIYNEEGSLIEKILYDTQTSSYVYTYIQVYAY